MRECGISFWHTESGVGVAGYAEGSDAELPPYFMRWGEFTPDIFDANVARADRDGCEEWDLANGEGSE